MHPLKATPGSKGYSQYNGHTSGPGQIKWKINQKGMNLGKEQISSNEDEEQLVGVKKRWESDHGNMGNYKKTKWRKVYNMLFERMLSK